MTLATKPLGSTRPRWAKAASLAILVLAVSAGTASGQGFQGTLSALVEDTQGAVIPGASVTLRNQDTGETRSQVSSSTGLVVFPNLLVGRYAVKFEISGFKSYERQNIQVRANQQTDVNARLEVGGIEETVVVQAESDLISTRSSQLSGGTFDSKAIIDLPIMPGPGLDGSPINFAVLAPGVGTQPGGVVGQGGVIGGNRPRQNNFVVDGLDNNDPSVTGAMVPVIADAVADFSLLTNQFNAEYGHSTAGQFVSTLKSGTNDVHGGAWGYALNRHFNSLDNLTRATAGDDPDYEKPRFDRQRVGAQLGGPILKDKWFFYGAYEYRNFNVAGSPSGQILVPTAAGLGTLQALASDPRSGVSPLNVGILRDHVPTAGAASSSVGVLNEGTGALVPVEVGAFTASTPNYTREHLGFFSTDYQTGLHRFSGRFTYYQSRSIGAGELPTPEFNSEPSQDTKRAGLSWVWTARPNVVNELRGGFTDNKSDFPVPGLPGAPSGLDLFGNYDVDELSLYIGPDSNLPQGGFDKLYQVANTTTWITGNHTFKFGAEWRRIDSQSDFLPRSRGENIWATLDGFVRDTIPDQGIRGVGKVAFDQSRDAIYGFVQDSWRLTPRFTLDLGLRYEWTDVAQDTALQDLNNFASILDVRTEVDADGNNIWNSLDPFWQQRILSHVGESLIFKAPTSDKNNFSPRIGFAWDVFGDGRTSIRGGFAWTQDVIFGNLPLLQLPPQAQAENRADSNACLVSPAPAWCAVGGGGLPGGENVRYSTSGYLAGGGLLPTFDPAASEDRDLARSLAGSWVEDDVAPETLTWSLAFQRELAQDLVFEARYIGTQGRKLPVQRWVNAGLLPTGGFENYGIGLPIFLNESDALGRSFAGAPTRADVEAMRYWILEPYGFFGTLTEFPAIGESRYHGGSVSLTKRFSNGFAFNANYTLSKATDWIENELNTSTMNPRRPMNMVDPELDEGDSGLDKRHKAVLSWQWELPSPSGGFAKALLGNWSWNGMFLFETGQGLTVISRTDTNGDFDSAGDRAWENPNGQSNVGSGVNFVCWNGSTTSTSGSLGGCGGSSRVVGYVAQNPNAQFVLGALGAVNGVGLVETGRGNFHGPGNIATVNMALYKTIQLGGSARMRLGAQVINLTNTPSFALGSGSGAYGSTTAATGFPGYVQPNSPQFLDETIFSGSLGQLPYQRVIQFEARIDF